MFPVTSELLKMGVKNETGRFLKFNHVEIPMGETAVIKSDKHCQ